MNRKRSALKLSALILLAAMLVGCTDNGRPSGSPTSLTSHTTRPYVGSGDPFTQTGPTVTGPEGTGPTVGSSTSLGDTTAKSTGSTPETPSGTEAELLAVGDNLFHSQLIREGEALGYDRLYSGMKDMISAADLAIINQETVFTTGAWTTYPSFATPTAVGDAAIAAGFDVFTCATNHTWDKGMVGVQTTLDYFAAHPEVTEVGLNNTKAEREQLDIVEANGIKIAFFNFGTLTNRTAESWWKANFLDKSEQTRNWIAGMVAKAKEQADFIIVCVHWGDEYDEKLHPVYTVNSQQTYWAQFFADLGVDLIIGGHPHVVQPVQYVEGQDGHRTLVYYSLGNFLHAQNDRGCNVGGLAKIKLFRDDATGEVTISDYQLLPTMVDCQVEDGVNCYTARLLSDITDEMLQSSYKWGDKGVTVADFEAIFEEASTAYPNQTPTPA